MLGNLFNSCSFNKLHKFFHFQPWRELVLGRKRLVACVVIGAASIVIVFTIFIFSGDRMPDFRQFEAGEDRKARFFTFIRPVIKAENAHIVETRMRLQELAAGDSIGWLDQRWLYGLAKDYGVDPEGVQSEVLIKTLLHRVDVIPLSLALAQAAKESGWGTSRFAREGLNLFGEWCYEPGCGLVPLDRDSGRSHEVREFDSVADSVASYMRNINTHHGYRELRRIRAALRAQGKPLSGLLLADQLHRYSERGQAYVEDIKGLIRHNDLEKGGA